MNSDTPWTPVATEQQQCSHILKQGDRLYLCIFLAVLLVDELAAGLALVGLLALLIVLTTFSLIFRHFFLS
jgi:hypothetical protein